MAEAKKSRILDIALQAGLSTATVDRVLNNRPGVREKTRQKIHEAIRHLEAAESRPRIIPSLDTPFEIDVIIAGSAGFSNEMLAKEMREEGRSVGLTLRTSYPRRHNPEAFVDALRHCIEKGSSGIIVQALDHPLVRDVIDQASSQGVPVISLLTPLPGSRTLGYVGLDNRAAGRTAGTLMGLLARGEGEIAVFVGGPLYRGHEEREMGFRAVLRENYPGLTIAEVNQSQDDPDRNYKITKDYLKSRPDLKGILNVGGGNRGIEKALLESGRKDDITYVCFNLTPLTKQALLTGAVDAVVHQDMGRVARTAIRSLSHHLTARPVDFPQIPIEIVLRENVR